MIHLVSDFAMRLRSGSSMVLGPVTFFAREHFSSSVLPSGRELVERMIFFLIPRPKGSGFQISMEWAAKKVAEELCEHWKWCNLYPKHNAAVFRDVLRLYQAFKAMQKCPKARMTEKWVQEKLNPYVADLQKGFDIRTEDKEFRVKQEKEFGVKETEDEEKFYLDQIKGERVGYCETFVDRKWLTMNKRRNQEQESYEKRMDKEQKQMEENLAKVPHPEESEEEGGHSGEDTGKEYTLEDDTGETQAKRRRREGIGLGSVNNNDALPEDWEHIRWAINVA